jgi:hypothetical protein
MIQPLQIRLVFRGLAGHIMVWISGIGWGETCTLLRMAASPEYFERRGAGIKSSSTTTTGQWLVMLIRVQQCGPVKSFMKATLLVTPMEADPWIPIFTTHIDHLLVLKGRILDCTCRRLVDIRHPTRQSQVTRRRRQPPAERDSHEVHANIRYSIYVPSYSCRRADGDGFTRSHDGPGFGES